MFIVFAGLFSAAVVGISMTGSNLAILSQGSCFILPVIAVLWVRVRKESKTKARKKVRPISFSFLSCITCLYPSSDTRERLLKSQVRHVFQGMGGQ